ncbi:hypothetical protein AHAS_Ahas16G0245200 [Arachis hypogaea]
MVLTQLIQVCYWVPILSSLIEALSELFRNKSLWKEVWNVNNPAKIKVFLWNSMHGGLPMRKKNSYQDRRNF